MPSKAEQEILTPRSTPKTSPETMPSMSASATSSFPTKPKGNKKGKKKRKLTNYFERLIKLVLGRQEKMQRVIVEVLEKNENDRIVREEAWRAQYSVLLKSEQEILAQESAIYAARDAALVALLQNIPTSVTLG